MHKKYTVLELFAGAGGLALGLEKAGLATVGLIDIDKDAVATLKQNRPQWHVINDDIANVINKGIKNVINVTALDIISGGAPCQSFSYAGKKLGLKETRARCLIIMLTLLKNYNLECFYLKMSKD